MYKNCLQKTKYERLFFSRIPNPSYHQYYKPPKLNEIFLLSSSYCYSPLSFSSKLTQLRNDDDDVIDWNNCLCLPKAALKIKNSTNQPLLLGRLFEFWGSTDSMIKKLIWLQKPNILVSRKNPWRRFPALPWSPKEWIYFIGTGVPLEPPRGCFFFSSILRWG